MKTRHCHSELYTEGVIPYNISGNFLLPQNRYTRCCLLLRTWALLCSALPIPHSSLLIPHFLIPHSSLPLVHFALKSYQIDRININFHKNAKNHLKPIDIPLWVWYSIDTLKHTKRLGLIWIWNEALKMSVKILKLKTAYDSRMCMCCMCCC